MSSKRTPWFWWPAGPLTFVVVMLTLVAASAPASARVFGVPAAAQTTTKVIVVSPFSEAGILARGLRIAKAQPGSCWTGSLVSGRSDAWRCFQGNFIHDPCFAPGYDAAWVACADYPWNRGLLRLNLTKPLPLSQGNRGSDDPTRGDPWGVQLANGNRCVFVNGATGFVAGMRINYFCTRGVLVGSPRRTSQPWTIFYRATNSTRELRPLPIATAWW
jgi:hypothetical protein